jgi:hypothetical protein
MKRSPLHRKTPLAKRSKKANARDYQDAKWRQTVKCRYKNGAYTVLLNPPRLCFGIGFFDSWNAHCHHIFGKQSHPHLRHEPLNGLPLSPRAHDWTKELRAWMGDAETSAIGHMSDSAMDRDR